MGSKGWNSQISRQSAQEGGKIVGPKRRPPLPTHPPPQETFLVLISVTDWVDTRATVWPEGLCQWKNFMTPSGIEPATYRPPRTPYYPVRVMYLNIIQVNFLSGKTDNAIINLLKPTGHVMHQQFDIQQLYVLPTLYLCVLYLSENKQPPVPLTA